MNFCMGSTIEFGFMQVNQFDLAFFLIVTYSYDSLLAGTESKECDSQLHPFYCNCFWPAGTCGYDFRTHASARLVVEGSDWNLGIVFSCYSNFVLAIYGHPGCPDVSQ